MFFILRASLLRISVTYVSVSDMFIIFIFTVRKVKLTIITLTLLQAQQLFVISLVLSDHVIFSVQIRRI